MKKIVENIKSLVKKHSMGNTIILDMNGVVLDSVYNNEDNLSVKELILMKEKLYADTNFGVVCIEDVIKDKDDWYTIENSLKDELGI